jgi:hypothetical protein
MNPSPQLTALFCDDVRREEGNKLSYMGVYTGVLGVVSFPALLPRLCFALTVRIPADAVPAELRFRLMKDEEVIAENVVPPEALTAARAANLNDDRFAQFGTIFQVFPVPLEGPCFLRARAIYDGVELKGGSLAIVEQQNMETALQPA